MPRKEYSGYTFPTYIVDHTTLERDYGCQILWDRVDSSYRSGVVKVAVSGAVAQNATTVPVAALSDAIPAGRHIRFSATKYITTTVAAAKGATSLTTEAVPVALTNTDVAYTGGGVKQLKAGTILSKAVGSERYIPRALKGGSDGEASCILFTAATDLDVYGENGNAGYTGYGQLVGGVLFENLMPDADPATGLVSSTYKTELKNNTKGFVYRKSVDSRAA